jgi:hypothetical protein
MRSSVACLFCAALLALSGCAGGDAPGTDAGPDAGADAGHDAGADAGHDAGADAGHDAGADAGHDAGPVAGNECSFNSDCIAAERCECSTSAGCSCKPGARGTGTLGVTVCASGNDCASALCVEGPGGTYYCSGPCTDGHECTGAMPRCLDVAFVGRICVRNP